MSEPPRPMIKVDASSAMLHLNWPQMAAKLEFISTTRKINIVVTLALGISRFVGMVLAKGMSDQARQR